jgi:hypothetical protein
MISVCGSNVGKRTFQLAIWEPFKMLKIVVGRGGFPLQKPLARLCLGPTMGDWLVLGTPVLFKTPGCLLLQTISENHAFGPVELKRWFSIFTYYTQEDIVVLCLLQIHLHYLPQNIPPMSPYSGIHSQSLNTGNQHNTIIRNKIWWVILKRNTVCCTLDYNCLSGLVY